MRHFLNVLIILLVFFSPGISSEGDNRQVFFEKVDAHIDTVIREDDMIKGLSVALFTNDKIIWKMNYGQTTYRKAINDSTLFSIQSISKNFTALAVLMAVQDSLLNLDTPILEYLPGFTVNSAWEDDAEKKITLRHLLAHSAGFTHEAPCGNNFDYHCGSKQDHWRSIRNTWLKFPVDSAFSYSNLGYDLAAEIIEEVSQMPVETYMKRKIFKPLGMKYSTVDDREVTGNQNRTEGYIAPYVKTEHYKIPLIGSGAVYANIVDMIKYGQFHLNFGKLADDQLLERKFLHEMYRQERGNFGLGITSGKAVNKEKNVDTYYLNHNGGGFGYGSTMTIVPEHNIGVVAMGYGAANYSQIVIDDLLFDYIINFSIKKSDELTKGFIPIRKAHSKARKDFEFITRNKTGQESDLYDIAGQYEVVFRGKTYSLWARVQKMVGFKKAKVNLSVKDGQLMMSGYFGDHKLAEFLPGLFFTEDGEAFDFRDEQPTYRNIKLRRI